MDKFTANNKQISKKRKRPLLSWKAAFLIILIILLLPLIFRDFKTTFSLLTINLNKEELPQTGIREIIDEWINDSGDTITGDLKFADANIDIGENSIVTAQGEISAEEIDALTDGINFNELSGQLGDEQISDGAVDLDGNEVDGTLPINSGGTNSSSFTSSQFIWYNGSRLATSGYSGDSFMSSGTDNWVNTSGDTMTGSLTISGGNNLILDSSNNLLLGTTSLGETTSPTDSGAFVVGTFDEFGNSNSANVQDVLDDLDQAITDLSLGGVLPDSLDYTEFQDSLDLDASTSLTFGSYNYTLNLNNTGDFLVQDNGTTHWEFRDDGNLYASSDAMLNMGGNRIENVANPNSGDDALNLTYANTQYINDGTGEINAANDFNFVISTFITNLDSDTLDGQQGTYYTNASNINAGTLGTSYFSAYSDLTAENYLNNDADSDILIRSQADTRYISSSTDNWVDEAGDTMTGNLIMNNSNIIPNIDSTGTIGSPTAYFSAVYADELYTSGSSLYMNGNLVLESQAATLNFTADLNQSLQTQTSGSGNMQFTTNGSGNVQLTTNSTGDITLNSNDTVQSSSVGNTTIQSIGSTTIQATGLNANVTINASGVNSQAQLAATDEIDLTAPIVDINGNLSVSGNISDATWLGNTIGTGYFSAYSDLTAEGYLNNDAGTDLLTRNQSDARYLIFTTFDAPSGTDPVADSYNDTLTFLAGSNITITGDSSSDTITIAASGGDSYNYWIASDNDDDTYTVTSLDTLKFAEGAGIDVNFTGDDLLTFTNTGDLSTTNELQNLWATFNADSGTTTANSLTDTLTVSGGGIVTTAIVGDTLTITGTEADNLASVSGRGASTTNQLSFNYNSGAPFTVLNSTVVTNLNADLLDGQEGSYYTNASNINAGTLGTGYFSAYSDLTAEAYLDNDADSDILIRSQADARYLSFRTFSAPSGTNPVADLYSDTLTFSAGSNITITGDATSDTITIAASTGSSLWTDGGTYIYPNNVSSSWQIADTTGDLTLTGDITLADGNWIGNGTGADQPYLTFDDTNNYFEFMGGNVGMGTTSPNYQLHVVGSGYFTSDVNADGVFRKNGGGQVLIGSGGAELIWYNGSYISWGAGGTANYFSDNVGIGTTGPGRTLDVAGGILFNGLLSTGTNNPNPAIRIRHIDGKAAGTDTGDYLYLNYSNAGKGVVIGDTGTDHELQVYGIINAHSNYVKTGSGYAVGTRQGSNYRVEGSTINCVFSASTYCLTSFSFLLAFSSTPVVTCSANSYTPVSQNTCYTYVLTSSGGGISLVDVAASVRTGTEVVGYLAYGPTTATDFDLAESYKTKDESIESGDVVCVDPKNNSHIVKCSKPYDPTAIGIVSTEPGLVIGDDLEKTSRLVGLQGRVPVKVTLENGPIERGDPLTPSTTHPGYAMKATKPGQIIGKALQPFNGTSTILGENAFDGLEEDKINELIKEVEETGEGQTMAFINISWYEPEDYTQNLDKIISDYNKGLLGNSGNIDTLSNLTITNSLTADSIQAQNGTFANINVGNMTVTGNLNVTGLLTAHQIKTGILQSFDSKNLVIKLSEDLGNTALEIQNSLGETVFSIDSTGKLSIKSDSENASVGTGEFEVGQTEAEIKTTVVTSNSKVFITPGSIRDDIPTLGVIEIGNGYFKVNMEKQRDRKVEFNWWVIN